jgi:hypothetical protein
MTDIETLREVREAMRNMSSLYMFAISREGAGRVTKNAFNNLDKALTKLDALIANMGDVTNRKTDGTSLGVEAQTSPAKPQPCEIRVVDKAALKQALDFLDLGFTPFNDEKQLFIDAARAYLRTEPDELVEIISKQRQEINRLTAPVFGLVALRDELDVIASASLEGQGVAGRLQAIITKIDEGKYAN